MPGPDLALLHEAALEAGRIAERYFRADPEVWDKGGGQGPVTEADLAIDAMLKEKLLGARPDYGWLSEETGDTADRLEQDRVFIIDPIDGTRSFIEGHKTFSHSLAIAENGEVIAAAVHLPMRGETFLAEAGGGATKNGDAIRTGMADNLPEAKILTNKANLQADYWPNGVPEFERHFRSSLAFRLCLVAENRFDGMLTLRNAWEWDVAAGDLICREAGVTVSDRLGVMPQFNSRMAQQAGFIAASPAIHDALMLALQE